MHVANLVGVESEVHVCSRDGTDGQLETGGASELLTAPGALYGCKDTGNDRACSGRSPSCSGHEFLPNGSRVYLDHDYLEYATHLCAITSEAVAAVRAGDVIVCRAADRLRQNRPGAPSVTAIRNNIDHRGHSYGAHVNVRMTRRGYERIFRDPVVLHDFLVPFFVTLPVICGAGRCGSEEGDDLFQIWQRADFFEELVGWQTTAARPLINSRDEPLTADPERYARFHVIAFDANRMEVAEYLKLGLLRLACAAIDARRTEVAARLADPIAAIRQVSRDPFKPVALDSGRTGTAIEIQRRFQATFTKLHERNDFACRVPDAAEVLARWDEVLTWLETDPFQLVGKLDWVTKYVWLEQARRRKGLCWCDPRMKWLDIQYHRLNGHRTPAVPCTRVTMDEQLAALVAGPPEGSRAAIRGELIRRFGGEIAEVNWHWLVSSDGKTAYILPDDVEAGRAGVPAEAKTLHEAAASLGLLCLQPDIVPEGGNRRLECVV